MTNSSLETIRRRHQLKLILLHGSQVDGRIHPHSDYDIAVVATGKYDQLKLYADLSRHFDTDKLDIADITHADPLFLYAVLSKSKLIAGSQKDYDHLQHLAFHKYQDYQPYLQMEANYIKERLKRYVTA